MEIEKSDIKQKDVMYMIYVAYMLRHTTNSTELKQKLKMMNFNSQGKKPLQAPQKDSNDKPLYQQIDHNRVRLTAIGRREGVEWVT